MSEDYLPIGKFLATYKQACENWKESVDRCYGRREAEELSWGFASDLGWYDWFCKATALRSRTEKYGKRVESIVKAVPELLTTEGSEVYFTQNWGDGYIDSIAVGTRDFGWMIRMMPDYQGNKYYICRRDRMWGPDLRCKDFREVLKFLESDSALWRMGYLTREYDDRDEEGDRTYNFQKRVTPPQEQ